MEHAKATDELFKDQSPELKALANKAQKELRAKKRADWWDQNNPNAVPPQQPQQDLVK